MPRASQIRESMAVPSWVQDALQRGRRVEVKRCGRIVGWLVPPVDLDTLERDEEFLKKVMAPLPPAIPDRCLECGMPHFHGPYMREPTPGCSMCEAYSTCRSLIHKGWERHPKAAS